MRHTELTLLQKSLPRRAKSINQGGFCNRLGATVMVNQALTETVLMPASVNKRNLKQSPAGPSWVRKAHSHHAPHTPAAACSAASAATAYSASGHGRRHRRPRRLRLDRCGPWAPPPRAVDAAPVGSTAAGPAGAWRRTPWD